MKPDNYFIETVCGINKLHSIVNKIRPNIIFSINDNGILTNQINGLDNIIVPMASFTEYQMGPFDNLVLTTGNPKSEYVKLVNTGLADKEEVCIYQGHENPLKCKKTIG